jgi:hypothetical protein
MYEVQLLGLKTSLKKPGCPKLGSKNLTWTVDLFFIYCLPNLSTGLISASADILKSN